MKKTILYLSYDGLTDPLGQSQVLAYMLGIADLDFKVIIISFEKQAIYAENKQAIFNSLENYTDRIIWHPLIYTKYPPVLSTMWDIFRLKRKINSIKDKIDLVHCRSYITSLVGLKLKKKGLPFIFDMRGFWPDERVEGGLWNLNNPIIKLVYKYFKNKEIQFLINADYTISLTEKAKDIINSWSLTSGQIPISVIPTCVDTSLFDPNNVDANAKREVKSSLNIEDEQFVISYIGSLGSWYMLDEMLDLFAVLLKKKINPIFLIVTKDSPTMVWNSVAEKNIDRKKIRVISANRKRVPIFISLSNWSIFFIKPVFSKSASAPTKLAEISAMGKPVLCNSGVGDLYELFKENKLGVCIEGFNSLEYEAAVDFIVNNINMDIDSQSMRDTFGLNKALQELKRIYYHVIKN